MASGRIGSGGAGRGQVRGSRACDERARDFCAPDSVPASTPMSRSRDSLPEESASLRNSYGLSPVISEFTSAWEHGDAPSIEEYLDHLDPSDARAAVELIYREYCLAAAGGQKPE